VTDGLQRLWAGWRSSYVSGHDVRPIPDGEGTIFERILSSGLPDEETYVLARGHSCAAMLNVYPYGTGHLMVMPQRAVPDLLDLSEEAHAELWAMVRAAVGAIHRAYSPDGVNVGANLGRAAGASIPDHLHVHCLPRWTADSTFLATIAETRMLPEPLDLTWEKLRSSWPQQ
jgi:diadenosine tetraphosphate (Ap4A) HIT family hydrolase